jgi:hypothetical protein
MSITGVDSVTRGKAHLSFQVQIKRYFSVNCNESYAVHM